MIGILVSILRVLRFLKAMGQDVLTVVCTLLDGIKWLLSYAVVRIGALLSVLVSLGVVLFGILRDLVADLFAMLDSLGNYVATYGAVDVTSHWSSVMDILAIANYIYPLEETFLVMTWLLTLWVMGSIYRFVKNWLPELFGFSIPGG